MRLTHVTIGRAGLALALVAWLSGCDEPRSTHAPVPVPGVGATPWTAQFGSPGYDAGLSVGADANGDSVVVGYTDDTLPGEHNAGLTDVFLSKLDPMGARLWTTEFGTSGGDQAMGIATDAGSNTVIVGSTEGSLSGQPNLGSNDIFLAKFGPDGTRLWATQLGGAGDDRGLAVAVDGSGNVAVVGTTTGALAAPSNLGGKDMVVAEYDGSGKLLWANQLGTSGDDIAAAVTTDAAGDVVVTGTTLGALPSLASAGQGDIVLVKYDPAGNPLWTRQWGGAGDDFGSDVTTDAAGDITLLGGTDGALPGLVHSGDGDVVLARYDKDGARLWATEFGTPAGDFAQAITNGAGGTTTLIGYTNGTFSGQTNAGGFDVFLAAFDAAGNRTWLTQFGTAADDFGIDLTVATDGSLLLGGETWGSFPGDANAGNQDVFVAKRVP